MEPDPSLKAAPLPSVTNAYSQQERTLAMVGHLLAFAGFVVPFGNLVGPLLLWLLKKDQMPLVAEHAKESLNFQISVTLYAIASSLLALVLIGFFFLAALFVFALVVVILASIKAYHGEPYRYPLCIRLVK